WAPLALPANARADRRNHYIFADARLRDGVSLRQARAEMTARGQRLEREYPDTNADREIRTVLLREVQMEVGGPFLVLLQAVALFVLLIACANVANLQLAQAAARK